MERATRIGSATCASALFAITLIVFGSPSKPSVAFDTLTVRTELTPMQLVTMDVNGDGKPDLVAMDGKENKIGVLLGRGDGTFDEATGYDVPQGRPFAIAACRSRNPAVVTANLSDDSLSVFSVKAGKLEKPIRLGTSPGPVAVACGDLDGDGIDEVVVASMAGNSIDIFKHQADGFSAKTNISSGGRAPRAIVIADLNHDGRNDIVVANNGSGEITVLLNKGGGTFSSPRGVHVGIPVTSLYAADFNGDGAMDIAAADAESNTVSVFVNRGDGALTHMQDFTASGPAGLAAADLNRDGTADLVIAESGSNSVGAWFSNHGKPLADAAHLPTRGENVVSVAVADINGDGKLDIVAANPGSKTISVLLQDVVAPRIESLDPQPTTIVSLRGTRLDRDIVAKFNTPLDPSTVNERSVLVSGSQSGFHKFTATYNASKLTVGLTPADRTPFDPGEVVSVMLTDQIRSAKRVPLSQPYTYAFNVRPVSGDGKFVEAARLSCDKIPGKLRAADLDNDGKVDIVSLCREVDGIRVMFNKGKAEFEEGLLLKTHGYGPWDLILADFNRDNKIDIAVVNTFSNDMAVFYNQGNRKFSAPAMFPAGAGPMGMCTGDFNGDGYMDIAVVTKGFPAVLVYMNDGKGGFLKPKAYTVAPSPYDISSRDINGDGAPDLVMTNLESDRGTILINNGDGTFRKPQEFPLLLAKALTQEPIDVNGDGKTDIVAVNTASDDLAVFLNEGGDKFKQLKNIAVGPTPTDKIFADFNHDGKVDIAVTLDGGEVAIMMNNGDGTFTKSQTIPVGKNPTSPVAADFDGDGTIDLAIANRYSFDISILLNTNDPNVQRRTIAHRH
jgi:hypothetical protein